MLKVSFGRSVGHRVMPRTGVVGALLLTCGLALAGLSPVSAQSPAASPSPKYIPPKECPPPEGFRAVLHLLDNTSGTLQMYPLRGLPMPTNMFAVFGEDMIPKCALERTYDDLSKFRTEAAKLAGLGEGPAPTAGQLLALARLSYRGFKRWQWCLLLYTSKAPNYEYDGSQIPELKEAMQAYYQIALDSGKKFIPAVATYLSNFKGVENDAVEAKKRLEADEKAAKPRAAKDIAKDQAKVADYERRFRENGELISEVRNLRDSYKILSGIHELQKFSWQNGNPALTLMPMSAQLEAARKQMAGAK